MCEKKGAIGLRKCEAKVHLSFDVVATFFFFLPPDSQPLLLLLSTSFTTTTTGYGLAMLLQTAVAVRALSATLLGGKNDSSLSTVQQLGLFACALHGLWMAGFLLARDTLLETYR